MITSYIKNNYFPEALLLYNIKDIFTDEARCQRVFEAVKPLQTRYQWEGRQRKPAGR